MSHDDYIKAYKQYLDTFDKTRNGLPVYHAIGFGTSWKEINDNTFYFVTSNVNTGRRRVFKLMKTENAQDCRYCPLRKYKCYGVGCQIKELK